MLELLSLPELWVGLGLVGFIVYYLSGREEEKRKRARLARILTPQAKQAANIQESLRRKDPNDGSVLAQKLAGIGFVEKLSGRLEMAGMSITPQKLLQRVLALFGGTLLLLLLLGKSPLAALLVGFVVGVGFPHMLIRRKMRKRQHAFLKLFPEAIELIVRGLRAGLPVAESFNTVSREIPSPVGEVFAIISQQAQLGVPMERALVTAAARVDITEFNFFVTTIILQRETGGNLSEILSNLADMLRQRQMMKLKIFALSSEARASAYIVGSLPFFVFALLSLVSPDYLNPFYNDARGQMAMMGALGTIGFGALIMRKMTQLEI